MRVRSFSYTTCMRLVSTVEWLERPFVEFLEAKHLSARLQRFVLYTIARLEHAQVAGASNLCTTQQGFERVRTYFASVGRFGPSPLLFSLYGVSELAQAYCRYVL
jgi:Rab proteins geranylgeranyltransferase component A